MRGLHIGPLAIGRIPRIVGTAVSAKTLDAAARIARPAFDLVEIRADRMDAEWQRGARLLREAGIPLLLTVRSALEGGNWRGAEAKRKRLYLSNLDAVDAVDVEIRSRAMKTVARAARRRGRWSSDRSTISTARRPWPCCGGSSGGGGRPARTS